MRFRAKVATILLLLAVSASANARDLANYRCLVFNANFCLRLPAGAELRYSVPSDFDLYEISAGSAVIATMYAGNGIRVPPPGDEVKLTRTTAGDISVARAGSKGFDFYLRPGDQDDSIIHLSVVTAPESIETVRELVSSLRPCRAIRTSGQRCPVNRAWSKAILEAIR